MYYLWYILCDKRSEKFKYSCTNTHTHTHTLTHTHTRTHTHTHHNERRQAHIKHLQMHTQRIKSPKVESTPDSAQIHQHSIVHMLENPRANNAFALPIQEINFQSNDFLVCPL